MTLDTAMQERRKHAEYTLQISRINLCIQSDINIARAMMSKRQFFYNGPDVDVPTLELTSTGRVAQLFCSSTKVG